jgi:putative endonuclease
VASKQARGQQGESLAKTALLAAGYTIVTQNWRTPHGEIDIVAQQEDQLVFVEVRARTGNLEAALESVSAPKRARLALLAQHYLDLAAVPADQAWRVDLLAVDLSTGQIAWVRDILDW